jgi:hypothetical protein
MDVDRRRKTITAGTFAIAGKSMSNAWPISAAESHLSPSRSTWSAHPLAVDRFKRRRGEGSISDSRRGEAGGKIESSPRALAFLSLYVPFFSFVKPSEQFVMSDQVERQTVETELDPLRLLADMVAVFADPVRAERQIKKFQDVKAAAEKSEAGLATVRAKHDAHVAEQEAALTASRLSLRKREIEIEQRQGSLAVREERMRGREQADMRRSGRLEIVGFGGLSRERELVAENPDPHFDRSA